MRSGTHLVDVPTTNYKISFGSFNLDVLQQIYTIPSVVKRMQRVIGAAYSSLAAKSQEQESLEDESNRWRGVWSRLKQIQIDMWNPWQSDTL